MKLLVKRGKDIIAKVFDRDVELPNEFSVEGHLVRSIVALGVPILNEDRVDRWRVQIEDPDFKEALAAHLAQYGLEVEVEKI